MFDIGFFELLVIAVVLLLVMGPEKLPEVAKQAAFWVRKARQGMFQLRSQMKEEIDGTPFADFQAAKQEIADMKRDLRQLGSDLANAADEKVDLPPEAEGKSQGDTKATKTQAVKAEPDSAKTE